MEEDGNRRNANMRFIPDEHDPYLRRIVSVVVTTENIENDVRLDPHNIRLTILSGDVERSGQIFNPRSWINTRKQHEKHGRCRRCFLVGLRHVERPLHDVVATHGLPRGQAARRFDSLICVTEKKLGTELRREDSSHQRRCFTGKALTGSSQAPGHGFEFSRRGAFMCPVWTSTTEDSGDAPTLIYIKHLSTSDALPEREAHLSPLTLT